MSVFRLFSDNVESAYRERIRKAVQEHGDRFRIDDNGSVSVDLNSESFRRSLQPENADDGTDTLEVPPRAAAE